MTDSFRIRRLNHAVLFVSHLDEAVVDPLDIDGEIERWSGVGTADEL